MEYAYNWLMGVLWEELIRGERNPDHGMVALAFVLFVVFACVFYLFEDEIQYITLGAEVWYFGLFLYGMYWRKKYEWSLEDEKPKEKRDLKSIVGSLDFQERLHEVGVLVFLVVISNFYRGRVILYWRSGGTRWVSMLIPSTWSFHFKVW